MKDQVGYTLNVPGIIRVGRKVLDIDGSVGIIKRTYSIGLKDYVIVEFPMLPEKERFRTVPNQRLKRLYDRDPRESVQSDVRCTVHHYKWLS